MRRLCIKEVLLRSSSGEALKSKAFGPEARRTSTVQAIQAEMSLWLAACKVIDCESSTASHRLSDKRMFKLGGILSKQGQRLIFMSTQFGQIKLIEYPATVTRCNLNCLCVCAHNLVIFKFIIRISNSTRMFSLRCRIVAHW